MDNVGKRWRYTLTDTGQCGIMRVVNGYAICPQCGRKKLARVYPDSLISHAGMWCRACGEVNITITPEL